MKFAGASHGSLTHSSKTLFSPSLSSHTRQGSLNAHEQFDGDYPNDVPGACKRYVPYRIIIIIYSHLLIQEL